MKTGALNTFWWLLLLSLITTLLCAPFFRAVYGMGDEGTFLRGAELMLRGKKLYLDFFGFLPPGSYGLTAAWFDLAGISIGAARTLAILTFVGIACFTFLACQQASKNTPLSAALTIGWLILSQWRWMQVSHHWFTTFFSMAVAWAALAGLEQVKARLSPWFFVAGLAAGVATMVTPTRGALVGLAGTTAFFNLRQNRSGLAAYMLGGFLPFAGVMGFLAEQGTVAAALNNVIGFSATRYASIQAVPYGNGASTVDWPLKHVFLLATLLLLLLLIITRDWRALLYDRRLRLCAALALAGFLGCFPRPDIVHIGFAGPLALPLLALCAAELTRRLGRVIHYAVAAAALIGVGIPSAVAFAFTVRTALDGQVVPTPRGSVIFPFKEGTSELFQSIDGIPSKEGFFFYPYMPMMPFLVAREQVSKYDIFAPGYTTPAQYQNACLSVVRHASWVVIDRRFANYSHWKEAFPSMPDIKPEEAIRFERALDHALEPAVDRGFFELRRRRQGVSEDVCNGIAGSGV